MSLIPEIKFFGTSLFYQLFFLFSFFPPEAIFPCLLYPPSPAMKSRVSDPDFDPGVCTSKGEISSNVYKMIILDTIKRHLFFFFFFWQYLKHSFYRRLKISLRLRYRPPDPDFEKNRIRTLVYSALTQVTQNLSSYIEA